MGEFISWKHYEGKNYFLTDADLNTKEGEKLLKDDVIADLCGHGAIENYYFELKGKGTNFECVDFSSPANFPKEIVKAIKFGKMSRFGICVDILNEVGKKKYKEVEAPAWKKYEEVEAPARKKYEEVKRKSFWKIAIQKKYRKDNWK